MFVECVARVWHRLRETHSHHPTTTQAMREEFWDTQPHYGGDKGANVQDVQQAVRVVLVVVPVGIALPLCLSPSSRPAASSLLCFLLLPT